MLLAALTLIIMRFNLLQLAQPMAMQPTADDFDIWSTPFYLRYNTPVPDYLATMLPVPANYTYALGIPSAPYTQATVTR